MQRTETHPVWWNVEGRIQHGNVPVTTVMMVRGVSVADAAEVFAMQYAADVLVTGVKRAS